METTSKVYMLTPLRSNEKLPLLAGYTKEDNLSKYHDIALNKKDNYGIMVGKPSGVIVLDVDLKNTQNEADHKLWELDSVKATFGDTYIVRTPSGGLHVFLGYNDETMNHWTTKIGVNNELQTDKDNGYIDIKVTGMVVGEGSKTSKGVYKCINGSPDNLTELNNDWFNLLDSLQSPSRGENQLTTFDDILDSLENLGFTGIQQVSDYSFKCDQMGRGSTCPLCKGEHRSNHYQIYDDGLRTSVRNFSRKCNSVVIKTKPMFQGDTTTPPSSDVSTARNVTDYTEAQLFYDYMVDLDFCFVRHYKEHYWYNPNEGIWREIDKYDIRYHISNCDRIDASYAGSVRKQDSLITAMLSLVAKDDNFIKEACVCSYGKLPFSNGIWDFHSQRLLPFSEKYRFFSKIDIDFDNEIDEALAKEIDDKIIYGTFGFERGLYYKQIVARGLAGEVFDKVFPVVIGLGNSGKGVNAEILERSFGKFVGTFNAGNLCKKQSIGDEAKARSWMIPLATKRLAICSETPVGVPLDSGAIKNFASGGDSIVARSNHKDEMEIKLQCTPIAFLNDMPEVRGSDDAVDIRMRYLETQYSYLPKERIKPEMTNARIADQTIKQVFVHRPDVIKTFAMMICRSYTRQSPVPPECVIVESKEWTNNDDMENKLLQLFEADKGSYISCSQLHTVCKQNGIEISAKKLGMLMKKNGRVSTTPTCDGKKVRAYEGIRLTRTTSDF